MAASMKCNPTTFCPNLSTKYYFTGDDALQKAEDFIFQFQQQTLSSFVKVKAPKNVGIPVRSELINKRVFWEEHSSKHFPISFDGVPFVVLGSQMRECCHGPDRHRSEKHKAARVKTSRKADHEYTGDKRRRVLIQNTKKMDCPASIHIRAVVRFPIYQIEENSEWARRKQSKRLLADLRNTEEVVWEYRVYVALPPHDAHRNHRTDEIGSMTHNVDKKVIGKIHALVEDGVRDVGEMKRHIKSFSKTNFPGVPECSNRFFPNNRCLRNHMYAALSLSQFSTEDQENLQQHITAWRQEKSDDCFYFVPSPKEENNDSDKEDFIFVHQTAWQRRLLSMYGNEICLLDATYCVCKCDVALFFLCVSTNIGYITVGCFLVAAETVKNITRGLQILKQWNRDWSPAFFMTDYDQKEIAAIETTFPDCFTYLCDFHREQSWERWLKSKGVKRYKEELLQKMRDIAHADSEESFQDAVTSLKDSEYWQENEHLRVWFENQWLSASKRWVSYHRQSLKNVRVTTTNGLERQHYQLKQNYLKQYTEGTVTSLISTIINQFVPDSFQRYRESNAKCLDTSRMYSDIVPQFLHNRPQPFRDHCTKRLSSAMLIPISDITVLAGQKFKVKSADTSTDYVLDFSEPLPKCSCPDWKRSHLPCKHMLSILLKVQGCGWESLSDEFTNSPHLNVDRGVLSDFTPSSTSGLDSSRPNMFDTSTPVATKTHTTQRAQRQGTVALGSRCKMLASSIHSMLHLVQNTSDYEPIYSDLMALHVRIRRLVPKEAGLLRRPPRPGRKLHKHGILRKRRRYRKAQRKNVKSVITAKEQASARPRIVPLDSTFDESSIADAVRNAAPSAKGLGHPIKGPAPAKPKIVSLDDPSTAITDVERDVTDPLTGQADSSNSFRQTAETVLQQLLNTPPTDRPIVQIGPYTITDSSMHYLNSTLSDEVIDSCLHLMVTGNVCHIDCANMTAIFDSNGSQDSTSYLPRVCLF